MKERILTGISLAVVIGLATYFSSWQVFAFLFFGIMLLAGFEWSTLIPFTGAANQKIFFFCYVLLLLLSLPLAFYSPFSIKLILFVCGIFWLLMPFFLHQSERFHKIFTCPFFLSSIAIVVSIGFFHALILLKVMGEAWVFIFIALVASADSFAYFFGRKLGRHKLAPSISPGKSIEGVVAGSLMTCFMAIILSVFLSLGFEKTIGFILLAAVSSLISVVGDLFESLLKRKRGLKDSGSILPGHGGILDRIDGLSAVAPIFILGLLALGVA